MHNDNFGSWYEDGHRHTNYYCHYHTHTNYHSYTDYYTHANHYSYFNCDTNLHSHLGINCSRDRGICRGRPRDLLIRKSKAKENVLMVA